MVPILCIMDLEVPGVWDWSREVVLDLVSIKKCFMCVVTRLLVRLVLEDRARGFSASRGSEYR